MKRISWKDTGFDAALEALYSRPACPAEIEKSASEILARVHREGDSAITALMKKFDGAEVPADRFIVSEAEYEEAEKAVSAEAKRAIAEAIANITAFANACMPVRHSFSPRDGVVLGELFQPMERVGCYIPGGTAPLVSTVCHTVAIAKAAGVPQIVAATPPMHGTAKINPATLYAMRAAGATEVWRMGGVYAIGAMAYGTKTLKKVGKIAGPGNAYVAAAKKLVYGTVAIDMVAGPSEVMVIADSNANPAFAAADLLAQAEHGSGLEQAVLVSDSREFLDKVEAELAKQSATLKRIETIRKVLDRGVYLIEARDMKQAGAIASGYAPEHLEIQTASPRALLPEIKAAGAIFLGEWTPEPAGDFTAGPSHVLPTAGTARFFHGITPSDFLRRSSVIEYTRDALLRELPSIQQFASLEGLDAHGRSASIRKEFNSNEP